MYLLSQQIVTEFTENPCPLSTKPRVFSGQFQIRTVRSFDPDTINLLFGLTATELTAESWPTNEKSSFLVEKLQTFTSLSSDPLTINSLL